MKTMLRRRVAAQEGVFTAADAGDCGCDKHALSRLVRRGEVLQVRRAAYVDAARWHAASAQERHLLSARALLRTLEATELALSHQTALAAAGLPLFGVDLQTVHLTRRSPGRAGRREGGLWIHPPLVAPAFQRERGSWRVRPCVAVVQTSDIHGTHAGVVAADAALRIGAADRAELEWSLRVARLGRGRSDARLAVRCADGRSESPGESLTRLLFRALGLPEPLLQARVAEPGGVVIARVDFLFREQRTIVVFDGAVKYAGADGRGRWRRRSAGRTACEPWDTRWCGSPGPTSTIRGACCS